MEMSFADVNRLEAEREAKQAELVGRLSRLLSKSFSAEELRHRFH